jgi:hypothetical protein
MPTSVKENYFVIPMRLDKTPFVASMSRQEQTEDAIYISLKMMKVLETMAVKIPTQELPISIKELIANHLKTKDKISIRKMQGALGQGAFTKCDIMTNDCVIYSGLLEHISKPARLASQHSISIFRKIHLEHDIQYNATYCENSAKYFQHLPDSDSGPRNGEDYSVNANFHPATVYCEIMFSKTIYSIPIITLTARTDIPANSLIGFDYGFEYWKSVGAPFVYMTKTGKPLTTYWLESINTRNNDFCLVPLNIAAFTLLVCESYIILEDCYFLLPKESRESLDNICQSITNENGSRVISLPAIFSLNSQNFSIFDNRVFLTIGNKPFELVPNKLVNHFEIVQDILQSSAQTGESLVILNFPLQNLLKSSVEMIINLKSFLLKKNIIPESSFKIHVNPAMLNDMKQKHNIKPDKVEARRPRRKPQLQFFDDDVKRPSLPAAIVEQIIETEKCRLDSLRGKIRRK